MSHQNKLQAVMHKLLSDDSEYYPHLLEQRFPHILWRMIVCWDKPEMEDYLDNLLSPPPVGAKGFPQEAIFEIVAIKAVHRAKFPCKSPVVSPPIDKAPLPELPPSLKDEEQASLGSSPILHPSPTDEEHEAAMVFDRIHRW